MSETKAERIQRKWGVVLTERPPGVLSSRPPRRGPTSQRNLIADAIRRRLSNQFGLGCPQCFQAALSKLSRLSVAEVIAQADELATLLYETAFERAHLKDPAAIQFIEWADHKANGLAKVRAIIDEACQPYIPRVGEKHAPDLPGTRHFLYHIAPFNQSDMWRLNVAHVLKRRWLFNGRRVVAIVTGSDLAHPNEVKAAFGSEFDFIVIPNSSRLREVATFIPLMREVERYREDVTFYAHAKGVTRPVNEGVTVHPWTEILYETCLDYFPLVRRILDQYPMAGSMKKVGRGFRGSDSSWHYSGTYYWFRNRDVFSRNWAKVDQVWWGTESWPGVMFDKDEAGCIFHSGTVPQLNLYSHDYLKGRVLPELEQWKTAHQSERLTI